MENLSRSQTKALKEQRRDLEQALEHGPTRRFLRRLFDDCGLFAPNFDGDRYQEGCRSVALGIVREINEIDVNQFPRLMQEGANEATRTRVEQRKQETNDAD